MIEPRVLYCESDVCTFNSEGCCNASLVTIGDGMKPVCRTHFRSDEKAPPVDPAGKVIACNIKRCAYNIEMECFAHSLTVSSDSSPLCRVCQTSKSRQYEGVFAGLYCGR